MEGIAESHTWRRDRAPIKNVLYISNVGTNVVSCLEVEQYYRVNWDQAQKMLSLSSREMGKKLFSRLVMVLISTW